MCVLHSERSSDTKIGRPPKKANNLSNPKKRKVCETQKTA